MEYKLEEANKLWKEFRSQVHDLLGQACPSQPQDLRNTFLATQFKGNFTRRRNFRKTIHTKTKQQAVQAIGDMFRSWCTAQERLDIVDKAKASGKAVDKDELAWSEARRAKDKRAQTASAAAGGTRNGGGGGGGLGGSGNYSGTTSTATTSPTTTGSLTRRSTKSQPQALWRQYELAEGYPLFDDLGEIAPKLDLEEAFDTAEGYHFCTSEAAATLCARDMKKDSSVTFVIPPHGGGFKEDVKAALDKLNEDSDGDATVATVQAAMFAKDETNGRKSLDVHLVHANARRPLLPAHLVDDGVIVNARHAELSMDLPQEEELQISVIEPMCRVPGLEAWWKKFQSRPFPHFKDDMKVLMESAAFKPRDLRVRRDRSMNWRGEHLDDARVVGYIKVPSHLVDDYLAKSGRRGLVIDRAARPAGDVPQLANIKLPTDWTIADAIARLDKLPKDFRNMTGGLRSDVEGLHPPGVQGGGRGAHQTLEP